VHVGRLAQVDEERLLRREHLRVTPLLVALHQVVVAAQRAGLDLAAERLAEERGAGAIRFAGEQVAVLALLDDQIRQAGHFLALRQQHGIEPPQGRILGQDGGLQRGQHR
jgi:hypothetical protein